MTEPERLLEGGGSELERELLGALATERPSPALSRRMRQGLMTVGVLTTAKLSAAGIVALASVVSLGAGAAWIAARAGGEHAVAHASAASAVARAVARVASVAPAVPSSPPPDAPAPPPHPSSPSVALPSATSDLREQIALLDRARSAVRSHDSREAFAALAAYGKRFPRGEFWQEATALKIEALAQSGQVGAARALGKRFVAAHPESPHVERIERLVGTLH
jgi:TolA-binding protein